MSSRRREREGRHVSVGGAAADEALASLVKQFSDPHAFIRELIQNSLDAGAARIDVRMVFADGTLHVEVQDDGEGMDRPIIEGYLLTLFRSTKEDDLTKIGKFGIGFTSIFAMDPLEVVVDTGRDGVWHRVTFDATRAYTLSRLADPYEGTTVTLRARRTRAQASEDARKIRAAAERWCRYADGAITTSAVGTDEVWPPTPVEATFTVQAPVVVTVESDGFRAVLGPHPSPTPPIGFYNRGITLWEGDDAALPGVTFRVAGRHLEHTLTRDNVIRDRHHAAVMERLREAARSTLGPAVHKEAAATAAADDPRAADKLFGSFHEVVPWTWRDDAPLLPGHGGPLSLATLKRSRGWLDRLKGGGALWWAPPGCPIGRTLAAQGTPVVTADRRDQAHLHWAERTLGVPARAAREAWILATPAEGPPLPAGQHWGHLHGRATGSLAIRLRDPWALAAAPADRGVVVVDPRHPLVTQVLQLPDGVQGPLLRHAVAAALGANEAAADTLAGALQRAGGAR